MAEVIKPIFDIKAAFGLFYVAFEGILGMQNWNFS